MFRNISRSLFNKLNLKGFINRNISDYISNKIINNMPGSAVLQVVGSGSSASPKVVYLFTDHTRYLFNCGEGTQRLAHEYKIKLSRLEHIFITSSSWDNIGGIPGVSLTLQDIGVKNITLHGPPGLVKHAPLKDELFIATQKFAVLNTMDVKMADCSESNTFSDSMLNVKYVTLKRKVNIPQNSGSDELKETTLKYGIDNEFYDHEYSGKRNVKQSNMHNLMKLPKKESFVSISYICRLKDRLGSLDLQKCVEKGLRPGPLLGQLKNGQDVTLPDGTIVYSSEVKTPDEPGSVFIVLDVPDMEYLDSLLENKQFQMHQENPTTKQIDLADVIIHFTPNFVLCSEKYQAFMKLFPSSTKHLIVNDGNDCQNSIAIHRSQQKLHLLNTYMFPPINSYDKYISGDINFYEEIGKIKLNNDSNDNSDENNSNITDIDTKTDSDDQLIKAKTLTLYYLCPRKGLDRSQEVKINPKEYVDEVLGSEEFSGSLKKFHATAADIEKCDEDQKYPMVVFLGTGSCIPNKTRNTSGIMVHIDENHCILFDCGEGTFSQMTKFYGVNEIDNILRKLNTIYISHLHADHHIGLIKILQGRKKVLEKTSSDSPQGLDQKLFLLAPKQIELWLRLYDRRFETINDTYELLPNQSFERLEVASEGTIKRTMFLQKNGLSDLKTCYVRHCPNAFGIAMTTGNGKKITYSGDTMPCEALVEIGFNSDILIHEATMEDDLCNEAVKKLHSTTGQAIEISQKMQAKNTILTHFSQRYANIPRVSEETEKKFLSNNIGIAFDNMKVNYGRLRILPHMYPPLKLMFADHCEELEFRAEKRALKRNHSSTERDSEKNVLRKNKYKMKNL